MSSPVLASSDHAEIRVNRLVSIHLLRIVAAISVVLAHLSASYQMVFGDRGAIWDFFYGNFGVDLFFVISGFIMVYSSQRLFNVVRSRTVFLTQRIARIVPLYWLATTISLLQLFYMGSILSISWKTIIGSYAFLPFPTPQGGPLLIVGWTLNIEMFFYLIFSISVPYKYILSALITTLILTPFILFGHYFNSDRSIFVSGFTNPLMLEFVLGMWTAVLYIYGIRLRGLHSVALIMAAGLIIFLADKSGSQDIGRAAEWGVAFCCILAATTFFEIDSHSRFWLSVVLIGEATYAIYLVHWFILMNPPGFLTSALPPLFHPLLYPSAILLITVLSGIIIHVLIEKPIVRYVRRQLVPVSNEKVLETIPSVRT